MAPLCDRDGRHGLRPAARRRQPTARGSAWLMRGNLLRLHQASVIRDANYRVPDRNPAQGLMEVRFEQATITSGHDRGRGGSGCSLRLRDGGQPLHQRQLRRLAPPANYTTLPPGPPPSTAGPSPAPTSTGCVPTCGRPRTAPRASTSTATGRAGSSRPSRRTSTATYVVQFWMSGNPGTHESVSERRRAARRTRP